MWGVNPRLMCRQHLLGEHVEMHMFFTTVSEGKSIRGYIENELLNPILIKSRHEELVKEMIRRGYNHQSPMGLLPDNLPNTPIPSQLKLLRKRCKECSKLKLKRK
jgi:hypothetical protein